VEFLGRLGVERQVELVAPAELEAGARQRIIAFACGRMALCEIGRGGGDLHPDCHCHAHGVDSQALLAASPTIRHRGSISSCPGIGKACRLSRRLKPVSSQI